MSRVNKAPLSLRHLTKYLAGKEGKTAVVVGSVLDDPR
jgi:large subunit ribosomal protein L18e